MGAVVIPKPVEERLINVRDRVRDKVKQYGSLANYGYPIFESPDEIIALVYANQVMRISENELSRMLGVDKMSVYRWIKKFLEGKGISWLNNQTKRVETWVGSLDDVTRTVEEWLKPKAQKWIKDITTASCVQEFLKNPVKIQRSSKHGSKYTPSQVMDTLRTVNSIALYINNNRDRLAERLGKELASNPDLWDSEEDIMTVIRLMCSEMESEPRKVRMCERRHMGNLKRIKKFREWFKGAIGSIRQVISPKEATLFLQHYYKLKKLAKESNDNELKAFWVIAGLHIESGAREGWGSLEGRCERMLSEGVDIAKFGIKSCSDVYNLDLDSELVSSSLIGIKWDKAIWSPDGKLMGFKIWEEKTMKEWELRIPWLDTEIHEELERVYKKTQGKYKSVIKSILAYYGLHNNWTVGKFRDWYSRWCSKLKDLLGLAWDMTPHRLRSAHISILAELRIPMELVLVHAGNTGFGVGWDDLTTASIFYMRFSRSLIEDYLKKAEEIKQKIQAQV